MFIMFWWIAADLHETRGRFQDVGQSLPQTVWIDLWVEKDKYFEEGLRSHSLFHTIPSTGRVYRNCNIATIEVGRSHAYHDVRLDFLILSK